MAEKVVALFSPSVAELQQEWMLEAQLKARTKPQPRDERPPSWVGPDRKAEAAFRRLMAPLGLPSRAVNCFWYMGIRSIDEAKAIPRETLARWPNVGKKTVAAVWAVLHGDGWKKDARDAIGDAQHAIHQDCPYIAIACLERAIETMRGVK